MQLSEKELMMVRECLMGHLSTVEKFRSFSQACSDQEIKQLLDTHSRKMEHHTQDLMNMVQSSAMSSSTGYSPYSQSHQYGGSQWATQPSTFSQGQYGTQQGMGSPSQYGTTYGMGGQSQYGSNYGVGSQSQYGTQYGVGSQTHQKY